MSTDIWMNQKDVIHKCSGQLCANKKWNNAICSNMDRPTNYHTSKWSQKEKDKYHMILLTDGK